MKTNKYKIVFRIFLVIISLLIIYYLFYAIERKYGKSIPNMFWNIIFIITLIIGILFNKKKSYKLLLTGISFFLLVQLLVLLFSKVYYFLVDIFK
jgi:hypothetical protein